MQVLVTLIDEIQRKSLASNVYTYVRSEVYEETYKKSFQHDKHSVIVTELDGDKNTFKFLSKEKEKLLLQKTKCQEETCITANTTLIKSKLRNGDVLFNISFTGQAENDNIKNTIKFFDDIIRLIRKTKKEMV